MRKLNDKEKALEDMYIQNPIKFSTEIERVHKETGESYIESVIQYCAEESIDLDMVAKLITTNLKEKIEAEASRLNFLPKTGVLPL